MIRLKPLIWELLALFTLSGAQIPIDSDTSPLPSHIDNSLNPHFPEVIAQVGESCANANSIGYVFTYEINASRNASADDPSHQYPYFSTYNFLNDGSEENGTYRMFIDAWSIARENGIPSASDFGSIEPRSTKWMSGYERYLRAMENRVEQVDSLSFMEPGTFDAMKRWLFDHGNGSPVGGIFTITASALGIQDAEITSGPEKGKYIVTAFGSLSGMGSHTYAVVGYHDSIRFDANDDGIFSNTRDLNKDRKITQADYEIGAFVCANTWGTGSWDNGFVYVPYRLLQTPFGRGGVIGNRAYFITVKKEYTPRRAFKVSLTHERRSDLAISVGIAGGTASAPEKIRPLRQFRNAGGEFPMCGKSSFASIEIGLDVSDLADSLPTAEEVTYFLIIDAEENEGRCDAFSLMDYTGTELEERTSSQAPKNLVSGRNILGIGAPGMNVRTGPRNAPSASGSRRVRSTGTGLRLRLSSGLNRVRIVSLRGETVSSFESIGSGEWHETRLPLRSGNLVVEIDSDGLRASEMVPVIR